MQRRLRRFRWGIGRAEVIVTAVIVCVALALVIPYVFRQRGESRTLLCERRMARLALTMQVHEELLTEFPGYRNLQATTANGFQQGTGWVFPLLPHFDPDDPATDARALEIWSAYGPSAPAATRGKVPTELLPDVLCPAIAWTPQQQAAQPLSFVVNCGQPDADVPAEGDIPPDWIASGLMFDHLRPARQVVSMTRAWLKEHDGASATILLSENVDAGRWVEDGEFQVGFVWVPNLKDKLPTPAPDLAGINQHRGQGDGSLFYARPSSEHPGGVNIALADGSTRLLSDQVDYLAYVRQLTSFGAELKRPGTEEMLGDPWRDR